MEFRKQINTLRFLINSTNNHENELIAFLNIYLDSPDTDRMGRNAVVDNQCYILDGNSGKRMLDYIIQFIFEK